MARPTFKPIRCHVTYIIEHTYIFYFDVHRLSKKLSKAKARCAQFDVSLLFIKRCFRTLIQHIVACSRMCLHGMRMCLPVPLTGHAWRSKNGNDHSKRREKRCRNTRIIRAEKTVRSRLIRRDDNERATARWLMDRQRLNADVQVSVVYLVTHRWPPRLEF